MRQDLPLNITDIESKISGYRSFFDSAKEVNDQLFHGHLTSTQDAFLEILKEFDSYARANRDPDKTQEISLRITGYIDSLDYIEDEIRLEQEKRLVSSSSKEISHLFHQEDSILSLTDSQISDEDFFSHQDSNLTEEEIRLKAHHIASQEGLAILNSNASALFSVSKTVASKSNCPDFLSKKESQKDDETSGEFFEITIKDESSKRQDRVIKIARLKDGGYAIFSKSHDRVFHEVTDSKLSQGLFSKILKTIYSSSGVRHSVMGTKFYKITNGFYIDSSGKIISYDHKSKSLCAINAHEVSTNDSRIIENEIDLDSIYQLLTDKNYKKSTQSIELEDNSLLTLPKSYDRSRDRFGLIKSNGLIQIYQRGRGRNFTVARDSGQAIEFAKKLESDIKDTLIFDAISLSLRGEWDLLNKISIDPRITKESIVQHIQAYLLSPNETPFDINLLAKIVINVPSLKYQISKLTIANRSHFLPQIIYGQLDGSLNSLSFAIKIFSECPSFLDSTQEDGEKVSAQENQQNHNHLIKESLGFVTHSIVNVRGLDFDNQTFINSQDFSTAYTNCLSRYSRQLMTSSHEDFAALSDVIHQSFSKLITASSKNISLKSSFYLVFPLITKILASFANQPNLFLLMHGLMINALIDSKIDKNSKEYRAIILKLCASLVKANDVSQESLDMFSHLINSCAHDENLENLVKISLNQLIANHSKEEDRIEIFSKFPVSKRIQALSTLDFYPDNIDHHPDLTSNQIASLTPRYLTYDELQSFTRSSRKELNLLPVNIANSHKRGQISKKIRATESKYQHTKPDLINLTQTFVDYDRAISKTIITDHEGNVLYRMGDSIYDYIAAPIKYFFASNAQMYNLLLKEIESLNVAALDHGLNLDSPQDLKSLERLKPRLRKAIVKVAEHVYAHDKSHPYLTFLKGCNQSSEGEMLFDMQSFIEDKYPDQFICNSSQETITVKLMPRSVQYQSNCNIEISKRDFGQTATLAQIQATGLVTVDYANNSRITNDSFVHSFQNHNLDIKVGNAIQRFMALNANSHQFDEIFYDIITDPIKSNGLNSLFVDRKSGYHKVTISEREEQIYIPRNKESGFVFTVNRNKDRTIDSVILHEGLYEYYAPDDDYHPFSNSSGLSPANLKELSMRLENVSKLCNSISKNTRPLRDAFCELKSTKFNKKSHIGEIRVVKQYKFKFRSIGKLKSGKKLYLDENGRLLVNVSLTSVKLEPIAHPQPHVVDKLPIEEVSENFDLTFSAQHFDRQRKAFHRLFTTFKVKVRQIGNYKDANDKIIAIYQDNKGRRFKAMNDSKNLQEIFDVNLQSEQASHVQSILDSFKERASIHEIFDSQKPQALIEESGEVSVGKIQKLTASKNSEVKIKVREIIVKPCAKSPQKSFHIDRFGVIYTKDRQKRLQKHDLRDLDQDSKDIVLKSLELSGDNIRLQKIYNLLEKNSSQEKIQVNLKPYDAKEAHIFVKNGVKYALFQDESKDHHLMRLTYEKGVKQSQTGAIYDPDLIKLITAGVERKALYDDLEAGTYLLKGSNNLKIEQEEYFGLTIKSFRLSDVNDKIAKYSPEDQIIAIDSRLRILHKNPNEENYHIATYFEAKNLMPNFYESVEKSLVKAEDWKSHYTQLMKSRGRQESEYQKDRSEKVEKGNCQGQGESGDQQGLTKNDLHQSSKKNIKSSSIRPSTTVSEISIEHLHSNLSPFSSI